ncbi:MAG TPA: hypothetical protein DCE55_00480 [Planctomycetaceae bacterium]|nr:hypothetical protein [Planctomycetaceae bacterium]
MKWILRYALDDDSSKQLQTTLLPGNCHQRIFHDQAYAAIGAHPKKQLSSLLTSWMQKVASQASGQSRAALSFRRP